MYKAAILANSTSHVYAFNLQCVAKRISTFCQVAYVPALWRLFAFHKAHSARRRRIDVTVEKLPAVRYANGVCIFHERRTYFIVSGGAFQPEFSGPITNLTVPLGRDATFTCLVKHLGGYRVSCMKSAGVPVMS